MSTLFNSKHILVTGQSYFQQDVTWPLSWEPPVMLGLAILTYMQPSLGIPKSTVNTMLDT